MKDKDKSKYEWRLSRGGPYGSIYGRGGTCPADDGEHEYTYQPWLGYRNNHGECWKCGHSPGLQAFNEQCDENVRNDECGICGGPRGHYGECK
jgi:Zn ribbon nucleic-acid-binding protein